MLRNTKIYKFLSQYDPKLIFFGILVTSFTAFFLQSYVIIPYGLAYNISKGVQVAIVVAYFIVTCMLWLLLSGKEDTTTYASDEAMDTIAEKKEQEPVKKMSAYGYYSDFKKLFKDIQQKELEIDEAATILNQMTDLVDKLPERKKRWALKTCENIKKEIDEAQ